MSNIYAAADLADVYVAVFRVTATLADEHPRIERNILFAELQGLDDDVQTQLDVLPHKRTPST